MFQSTTKGILHFEDLDPKMFEAMCCNIIVESGLFDDIRPYGIEGADEGVDIFCVEKRSQLHCFFQCKRYQHLSTSDLYKIVDRIIKGKNYFEGQSLFVITSCDVSKKAQEDFETYAKGKGFSKTIIIGRTLLDCKLHQEKYRAIKERFFGNDLEKEKRAEKKIKDFQIGRNLVETKLLRKVSHDNINIFKDYLKHPELRFKENEIIIRSIYDEFYPDVNENGENSTWFKSELHDIYCNGIQVYLTPWINETIVITPNGEWWRKSEFDKNKCNVDTLEIKVNIIGRIPYHNIFSIEDGDNIFPCPHLRCRFEENLGPFAEICYEYVDYQSYERFLFEKGKRALISVYEFQKIQDRNNASD